MAKILTRCPVCDGTLGVSELHCRQCRTTIHGVFDPCRFCTVSSEHLGFIEMFLRCEGNLSRVEKELGLSYPTVRNRLQAALTALGLTAPSPVRPEVPTDPEPEAVASAEEVAERRRTVLEALASGSLSAEEAAEALRDLV